MRIKKPSGDVLLEVTSPLRISSPGDERSTILTGGAQSIDHLSDTLNNGPTPEFDAELFKETMKQKHLTRKDVASITGFSPSFITGVVNGNQKASGNFLFQLARAGFDMKRLLGAPVLREERLQEQVRQLKKENTELKETLETSQRELEIFEGSFERLESMFFKVISKSKPAAEADADLFAVSYNEDGKEKSHS